MLKKEEEEKKEKRESMDSSKINTRQNEKIPDFSSSESNRNSLLVTNKTIGDDLRLM